MSWLDAAWGKFKAFQRTLSEADRLNQDQMRAAWLVWDTMRKADASDSEAWADDLRRLTIDRVMGMNKSQRSGAKVFAAWVKTNREQLQAQATRRVVTDKGQMTDAVSAEIIRD